ncbi:MAG: ATP-binding protein [Candidatus Shapirobacteria bacterium]|nr:ATP-binding protein [Candidatus Shapirobacteria bacterium]
MKLLDKILKKPVVEEQQTNEGIKNGKRDFTQGLVTTKDIIAPSSLEVDFNYVRIDNKYYRTLFIAAYPRFVGINWLSSLINFDAALNISMFIYPTDGKEILDDLRRKITEMEAEMSSDIQRGRLVNPATQAKLEDAMNLQADLVKGEERFFQFGLYITISAETKEEIERINKNLEAALGSLLIVSKRTTLQMEDGFITGLPIGDDRLKMTRNMDTTSLATTFPFVSSDLSDDKGIMYGINIHNGSLVIFDRFSMPNYNSVVFAMAGAGKSYMIKLEVLRSLMLGTEIIVIDPENEYQDLATAVGGQYIAFGYSEASKINPFDLSLVEEEGENALNSKILSIHKLLKVMLGNMDPIEESILDKAMMDAYKMKGITPDPATQTREPPLIEDLYKSLIGMEEEKAKSLAARLEKYIKGSFSGIFNQKTTVNLTNQFVVFGIKNLEETLRPVAMHIILDYIWTVVKKNLKKRILVVDEAWYLMQYEDSAGFLRGIVKRGRKYYLGVTTITQDVDDFLATPYGKEIVTNSAIQILLRQHTAAIDQIGKVFYLSEGEKQLLLTADKGQGIFFAGQNHVAIQVISSDDEHKLITSNPEDVLNKRKLEAEIKAGIKQNTPTPVGKPSLENEGLKPEIKKNSTVLTKTGVTPFKNEPFKPEIKPIEQKPVENIRDVKPEVITEVKNVDMTSVKPIATEISKPEKFEPPKPEIITMEPKKPIFIRNEEVKIPQPPQLNKSAKPVFEQNSSVSTNSTSPFDKEEIKKEDNKKMDYDDLFGNGIV